MTDALLALGILVALFVGYNIGGATTGPAFGPAVGANVITKVAAAALMSVCFFVGAWAVGPRVVATLGEELVTETGVFTMRANVAVLFFIGGALFLGNHAGVPASTSMTAVGAIAALGFATGTLNWDELAEIAVSWIVAPIGAFTIARRTLDTLGNDITNLPLTAAIVVAVVSSTIVVGLSLLTIPASFVIIATMSIVGLGWGRATRTTTISDARQGEETAVSIGALTADEAGTPSPEIGEEDVANIPEASDLFDPSTTARVILMQNVVPLVSTVGAYVAFRFVPVFGF